MRLSVGRQSQGRMPRHPVTAGRKPNRKMAFFDITNFGTVFRISDILQKTQIFI
jgi:hypothetical protein